MEADAKVAGGGPARTAVVGLGGQVVIVVSLIGAYWLRSSGASRWVVCLAAGTVVAAGLIAATWSRPRMWIAGGGLHAAGMGERWSVPLQDIQRVEWTSVHCLAGMVQAMTLVRSEQELVTRVVTAYPSSGLGLKTRRGATRRAESLFAEIHIPFTEPGPGPRWWAYCLDSPLFRL